MSAPVDRKNASASSSRLSGLRTRIGFPVLILSGRFSHWSTLKTVYSRSIGTRRVSELSSAPLSRTWSCLTKKNLGAVLALADVATEFQCLLEGQEARRAITSHLCHPQQ